MSRVEKHPYNRALRCKLVATSARICDGTCWGMVGVDDVEPVDDIDEYLYGPLKRE